MGLRAALELLDLGNSNRGFGHARLASPKNRSDAVSAQGIVIDDFRWQRRDA